MTQAWPLQYTLLIITYLTVTYSRAVRGHRFCSGFQNFILLDNVVHIWHWGSLHIVSDKPYSCSHLLSIRKWKWGHGYEQATRSPQMGAKTAKTTLSPSRASTQCGVMRPCWLSYVGVKFFSAGVSRSLSAFKLKLCTRFSLLNLRVGSKIS